MNKILAKEAIKSFLIEDIGTGDLSTDLVFDNELRASGNFVAKDDGVVCGTEIIDMVYSFFSDDYNITLLKKDGESVKKGEIIATVEARVATMLSGERVALNLMQLMCGIATTTRKYVDTLNDNNIRVCDTRKTHPGLRVFEKYAVTCGGGFNHRFALYDGVMLKDNHIAFAGGITKAVQLVKSKLGHMVKVEVETETKEQVIEAVNAQDRPIVIFLWGAPAGRKAKMLTNPKHLVLKAPHPSPLSAYRGFFGCKHFSQTNEFLKANGLEPIDWQIENRAEQKTEE